MSLNEKYIINGSTLSDIGNALRSKGIISPTKEVTKSIFCYGEREGQAYRYQQQFSGIGTSHGRFPVGTKAYFFMNTTAYLTSSGITDYTGKKISRASIPTSFETRVEVTLPLSGTASSGGYSTDPQKFWFYLYPLKNDTDFYEEGQLDYSSWSLSYSESPRYQEKTVTVKNTIAVEDIATSILKTNAIAIDYEGLSYGYVSPGNSSNVSTFYYGTNQDTWLTFIPLTSRQKVGFCVGKTVSNRLRAAFFKNKTYSDFQQYVKVKNSSSSTTTVYDNGISITGSSELTGDDLLKRFCYTAPSNGMLVVGTSGNSTAARLHVWEVK